MRDTTLLWSLERTVFDLWSLGESSGGEVVLEPALPVSPDDTLSLGIRAHGRELGSDVAAIEIEVLSIVHSGDEQDVQVGTSPRMSIRIDDAMTKSSAHLASATGFGPRVAIRLRATRRGSAGKLLVELSGALYGRAV